MERSATSLLKSMLILPILLLSAGTASAQLTSTPQPNSPDDGAENLPVTVEFRWGSVSSADSYQLQVASESGFTDPLFDVETSDTTEEIAGLAYESSYYWRVRASGLFGTSNWSTTRSFTTEDEEDESDGSVPPPALYQPDDGETGLSTDTVRIAWERVSGATEYDFQLAIDSNFQNTKVDLIDVTSQHYRARNLEYGTTYWWRVRSKNASHISEWASHYFTTEYGPISYRMISPANGSIWRSNETRSLTWETSGSAGGDDEASGRVDIQFSEDDGSTWIYIAKDVDGSPGSYDWTLPEASAMNARIRITDTGNNEIQAGSDPFIIYPSTITVSAGYSFDSSSSTTDYRLIGLPSQTDFPVKMLFRGDHGDDWKVYLDNGAASDYLLPYDESEQFHFRPGNAFWAISREPIEFEDTFETVPLSDDTTYTIAIQDGWNIISNPFHHPMSWSYVAAYNNLDEPIWGFEDSYEQSGDFAPYHGYYFYNSDGRTELKIPYRGESTGHKKNPTARIAHENRSTNSSQAALEFPGDDLLSISVYSGNNRESTVRLGFDPVRSGESGWLGHKAPPGDFLEYYLTIIEEDDGKESRRGHYATVIRPEIGELQEYTLNLKARENRSLRIKPEGLQLIGDNDVFLVSKKTGTFRNLRDDEPVRITPTEKWTSWSLLIGSPDAVHKARNKYLPDEIHLAQNYPNPFNAQTVIEYSLPESESGHHVVLEIFDIQGRKVATLINEHKSAGFYSRHWDASNISSGVYIYRLQVGSRQTFRKLTLIK